MNKILKCTCILALSVILVFAFDLIADRVQLRENLIRLHVVGASDSPEDQSVKLEVRDAVIGYIQESLENSADISAARRFLEENLPELEALSNRVLASAGFPDTVSISLLEEEFPVRDYDTFSLPSGVYESLRIEIGPAAGRNWWCVIFPTLCLNAAAAETQEAGAGFSESLTDTITRQEGYEIRFFFLDCLGMLENFFHFG